MLCGIAHAFFALFAWSIFAVLWTWPVASHVATRLPHDPGDPVLNAWLLWWNAQVVPFTAAWWSPPILVPMRGALALSEHLAGLALFASPIQLAGGGPVLAYNVCLLSTYALSGWFAYLLVYRLTSSHVAAACGGLAFAAAPYRAGQLAHVQVLTSQWMPAMLLGLHGYLQEGRPRWLLLFAGAWLLQALSNGYFLLFFPVLLALWLAWFVRWRIAPRRGVVIVTTWVAASLPLVPLLLEYRAVHAALGLVRVPGEVDRFSARLSSLVHPPPLSRFWPSIAAPTQEDYLFPGATVVLITIAGLVWGWQRRTPNADSSRDLPASSSGGMSTLVFYSVAAVALYACALGPGPEDGGGFVWMRPYRWLALLPGYDGLRVPARFAMLAVLCLSVAAGLAVARLRTAHPVRGTAFAAIVLAGIAADGLMRRVPLVVPPPRAIMPEPLDVPVLELPADDARVNVAAMYRAMHHRRRIFNGYSGHVPPHFRILGMALRRGDTSPLSYLARERPLVILVNDQYDADRKFNTLVSQLPSIVPLGRSGAGSTFLLPRQSAPPLWTAGATLPARLRDAPGERLEIDLGDTHDVRGVVFNLRWRYGELSEQLLVERSHDGVKWEQATLLWTGALAVAGAVEAPLLTPIRIPLPGTRARYLRISPAPHWMGREMVVVGR